jgi:hypothetical protein
MCFPKGIFIALILTLIQCTSAQYFNEDIFDSENDTSTLFPESSTQEITTTSVPPVDNVYIVKDPETGNVCLLLSLNATFTLPYKQVDGKDSEAKVQLNHNSSTSLGMCSNSSITLSILWKPTSALEPTNAYWKTEFLFVPASPLTPNPIDGELKYFKVANLTLTYEQDNATFPNANSTDTFVLSVESVESLLKGTVGVTFACSSKREAHFSNSQGKMELKDFQVDAFRKSSSTTFSKEEWRCNEDLSLSNVVPIIVGIVLSLMVVVFLIAYIFGRNKTSHSAYQTMA